jgi:hypothetical protein
MNPEIEAEKNAIALALQQQATGSLIAELAAARVRIRELESALKNLATPPIPPQP